MCRRVGEGQVASQVLPPAVGLLTAGTVTDKRLLPLAGGDVRPRWEVKNITSEYGIGDMRKISFR